MYGDETIKKHSKFYSKQVSQGQNVYIDGKFYRNDLEDESAFLQLGQHREITWHTFDLSEPQPTSWNKFPNDDEPGNKFKYASFNLELRQDLKEWNRRTYSALDFLADLGGLYDMLLLIMRTLVAPISGFTLTGLLKKSLF